MRGAGDCDGGAGARERGEEVVTPLLQPDGPVGLAGDALRAEVREEHAGEGGG